ncbi:hypothetical protein [Ectobacillus ponti]|uniref:Uncharacterized protein n=1 Tax=Ectobacillus ponti TaxID=2961894 RepID=A0AA42BT70_9BACI|nr:hypothetical protein [Ectobacillus ponti]MCP8971289.1 hypothetical protein [Ectobacillus ponti]
MKSEKIPEHKLNVTETAGEAVENMLQNDWSQTSAAKSGEEQQSAGKKIK